MQSAARGTLVIEFVGHKVKRQMLTYLAARPNEYNDLSADSAWCSRFGAPGSESILAQVIWQALVDEEIRLSPESKSLRPALDAFRVARVTVPRSVPSQIETTLRRGTTSLQITPI